MSGKPRGSDEPRGREPPDEPPPILGTWRRLYGAVLAFLVLLIVLFWMFGREATP